MSQFTSAKSKKFSLDSSTTMTTKGTFKEIDKMGLLAKVIIIGESATGKTALMTRFVDDKFSHSHMSTIGIDFKMKKVRVEVPSKGDDGEMPST